MKYFKLYEQHNIESIMSDEDRAIEYLKSINFFEDHSLDSEDEIIIDNISSLVYRYRWLKDEYVTIYRAMKVPSLEDIDLSQTGYFWSFERDGVGTYDSGVKNDFNSKWDVDNEKDIVLTAITHKDNINWLESLVANAIYGDEQSECYLIKGSDINITHVNDEKLETPIKAKS